MILKKKITTTLYCDNWGNEYKVYQCLNIICRTQLYWQLMVILLPGDLHYGLRRSHGGHLCVGSNATGQGDLKGIKYLSIKKNTMITYLQLFTSWTT